jgi:putative MATE family efflux protein
MLPPPDRRRRILTLALPIIGGMVSQNVLNLVDTAMVGRLGDDALAAVGLGGFAVFMCMALILGVSTGVQATAARRKGEGLTDEMAFSLNAGLLLVWVAAPVLSLILVTATPALFPWLNDDPGVMALGIPYLQVRLVAMAFVGTNFAFRGYWNAVDLPGLYMTTLLIMHSVNIFLNWVLIFGNLGAPELGVTGAGIASAVSTVVGSLIYVYLGFRHARPAGFVRGLPDREGLLRLLRLSVPAGLQQLFFSAGFVVTFWIIGQVGTRELAAASVLVNVTLVAILPGLGLGLAASTLVSQALGRGDPGDAARWGWDVTRVAVVGLALLGLPMWLVPDLVLGVFIKDPETLEVARLPMRLVGLLMAIEAFTLVLMHALLGAGDARRVMMVAVSTQWLMFLPLAYLVGPVLGLGLTAIWISQGVYRTVQAGLFFRFWQSRRWARIHV